MQKIFLVLRNNRKEVISAFWDKDIAEEWILSNQDPYCVYEKAHFIKEFDLNVDDNEKISNIIIVSRCSDDVVIDAFKTQRDADSWILSNVDEYNVVKEFYTTNIPMKKKCNCKNCPCKNKKNI